MRAHDEDRSNAGLLILRGAPLLLSLTFGLQKAAGYFVLIQARQPLATSGLAPLIRSMGFPAPGVLGLYAVLCESVGALLVACGLLTRLAASAAAISMAAAFYVSLRLGEEPLRALLYLVVFATLAVTGPGKYSLDALVAARRGAARGRG